MIRHRVQTPMPALDFELDLPEDWRVQTRTDGPLAGVDPSGWLQPLWCARSADGRLTLQIGGAAQPAALGLAHAAAYALGLRGLEPLDDDDGARPVAARARRLATRLAGRPACLGRARSRPGAQDVHDACYAYLGSRGHVLELLLLAPAGCQAALARRWVQFTRSLHLRLPDEPPPATVTEGSAPEWWVEAQRLQAEGRLGEALALVARGCAAAEALLVQAELWRRQHRLWAARGDAPAAARAAARVSQLEHAYVAGATSGSEALARRQLVTTADAV